MLTMLEDFLAQRASHKNSHRFLILQLLLVAAVISVVALSVAFRPASALHGVDSDTVGIGGTRSTISHEISQDTGMLVQSDAPSSDLTQQVSRNITVKDPDPVIVLSAVDTSNATTIEKANQLGTLSPLPTAPRILPDLSDGWHRGMASAYSYADNDDGQGNFGTTATASGIPLSDNGITVAVPASQSYLIGQAVAIMYGETVIVATVTDTGGFAGYGRALDLAPGCWKAFGASTGGEWGVREVYYKFL